MSPLRRVEPPVWRGEMMDHWQWHQMARRNIFLVYWLSEEDAPILSRFAAKMGSAAMNAISTKDVLHLSLMQLSCSQAGRKTSPQRDITRKLGLILSVPVQNIIGTSSRLWLRRHPLQMPDDILRHTQAGMPQHILCVGRPGIKAPAADLSTDSLMSDTGTIDVLGILDARGECSNKLTEDPLTTMFTLLQMNNPATKVVRFGIDGLSADKQSATLTIQRSLHRPWWQ